MDFEFGFYSGNPDSNPDLELKLNFYENHIVYFDNVNLFQIYIFFLKQTLYLFLKLAWAQAQLALKAGGLGLRSAERHAPAAYLASRAACSSLCQQLWAGYADDDTGADGWAAPWRPTTPGSRRRTG